MRIKFKLMRKGIIIIEKRLMKKKIDKDSPEKQTEVNEA
jgi:hypothetical protein